mgnify:FL=1
MHSRHIFIFFFLFVVEGFCANYVSIKSVSSTAYLRKGPGKWYPIEWVLKAPGLPLKVLEENGGFKKVEIPDGSVGWLSDILISPKKTLIVKKQTYLFNNKNQPIAMILKNTIVSNKGCFAKKEKFICKVSVDKLEGNIKKKYVWGTD